MYSIVQKILGQHYSEKQTVAIEHRDRRLRKDEPLVKGEPLLNQILTSSAARLSHRHMWNRKTPLSFSRGSTSEW